MTATPHTQAQPRPDDAALTRSHDELLSRIFEGRTAAGASDVDLLARFAHEQDADAFAAIVARHGPSVLAVCRGVLGPDRAGADDAFQATFLTLMNDASRLIRRPDALALGGWLRTVARRLGRRSIRAQRRRARREQGSSGKVSASPEGVDRAVGTETAAVVRQELARLPESYRAAIVACDLDGLTREEAALCLGWPPGTVAGRLARARERLRQRLERRGLAPGLAWTAAADRGAGARLLHEATARAAGLVRGAGPSESVQSLVHGSVATGPAGGLKSLAAAAVLVVATAVIVTSGPPSRPSPAPAQATAALRPLPALPQAPGPGQDRPAHYEGRVVAPDGRPVAGARLFLVASGSEAMDPGAVRATTGADGRYTFEAPDLTEPAPDGLPLRRQGWLIASADGMASGWVRTTSLPGGVNKVPEPGGPWPEVVVRLTGPDVPIEGRVLDPAGQPRAGIEVEIQSLLVPYQRDLDAYLRLDSTPFTLFGDPGVSAGPPPAILPGVTRRAVTDADGRFRLAGLGRDLLAQVVFRGESITTTSATVAARRMEAVARGGTGTGEPLHGAEFSIQPAAGRTIRGVVRDAVSKRPIPGMAVGHAWAVARSGEIPTLTDDDGSFVLTGESPDRPDPFLLMAWPAGGQPYRPAQVSLDRGQAEGVIVECRRLRPFVLRVTDEAGRPVEAGEVVYRWVSPNPEANRLLGGMESNAGGLIGRVARTAVGTYTGAMLPGPGAVIVNRGRGTEWGRAFVDPKAFFAPGRSEWTAQERLTAYGTLDHLAVGGEWLDQATAAAIVLVNPPPEDDGALAPLELRATLRQERSRRVSLVDEAGMPVTRAEMAPIDAGPASLLPSLRTATFELRDLHPDRARRVVFRQPDRRLIGALFARGDSDEPITVVMRPWATVTGRILDENGRALDAKDLDPRSAVPPVLSLDTKAELAAREDPAAGIVAPMTVGPDGRFRIEPLVPGLSYSTTIWRGTGMNAGPLFENLVLQPGEVRDLGDVRSRAPVDVRGH
jgi:RNA polymerase sigma factor (sigma-70 family)